MSKRQRQFLPADFKITTWDKLQPYVDELLARDIDEIEALEKWFADFDEFCAVVSEDQMWRSIKMSQYTNDEEVNKSYLDFVENIAPKLSHADNELNQKFLSSKAIGQLQEERDQIIIRDMKVDNEIFDERNIPLKTELSKLSKEYEAIVGGLTVEYDGRELTMPQTREYVQSQDRNVRKDIYELTEGKRLSVADDINNIFTKLIEKRDQVGKNAGFENYRDYMFKAKKRFDYTAQDCFAFHDAVEQVIMPIMNESAQKRKEKLGLEVLRPYDAGVDIENLPQIKSNENGEDLYNKSHKLLNDIDPYFAQCIERMKKLNHFDLDSRKNKAPGGFNAPLLETGLPFVFMNNSGTMRDVETFVHEAGHAVHSCVTAQLPRALYTHPGAEFCEVASMAMEMITMDRWDQYGLTEHEFLRAQRDHIKGTIGTFPWVMIIDAFQHWVYENPNHTQDERDENWLKILNRFSNNVTDRTGYEDFETIKWQGQIHLFSYPFYYIEYAISQLGALAIWKNYCENPQRALEQYKYALSLGNTVTLPKLYEAAGIEFRFDKEYVAQIIDFTKQKLDEVEEKLKKFS